MHRCKPRLHLFITDEDVASTPDHPLKFDPPSLKQLPHDPPQISLNALSRMSAPKTFRIYDHISHHCVMILVDGGSTHNLIQAQVAKFLNLPTASMSTLQVMVSNGNILDCDTSCPKFPPTVQGHHFTFDLFQLPLRGADIVLGVQWLKHLGFVTTRLRLTHHVLFPNGLTHHPLRGRPNPSFFNLVPTT